MVDKILSNVKVNPTDVVNVGSGVGIAWNTKEYYIDIEVQKDMISLAVSVDRKSLEFLETDFENVDYCIKKLAEVFKDQDLDNHSN